MLGLALQAWQSERGGSPGRSSISAKVVSPSRHHAAPISEQIEVRDPLPRLWLGRDERKAEEEAGLRQARRAQTPQHQIVRRAAGDHIAQHRQGVGVLRELLLARRIGVQPLRSRPNRAFARSRGVAARGRRIDRPSPRSPSAASNSAAQR